MHKININLSNFSLKKFATILFYLCKFADQKDIQRTGIAMERKNFTSTKSRPKLTTVEKLFPIHHR